MTPDQEWCLACGAAVGTKVVAAPGWRMPLILVGLLALIAAIAIAIAIIQLADDTVPVNVAPQPTPAAPTPTPAPADPNATQTPADPNATPTPQGAETPAPQGTPAAPSETPAPGETPAPDPSAQPGQSPTPDTASWPAGEKGWTVVLASKPQRGEAEKLAQQYTGDGVTDVGILQSDDFSTLEPGFWVVYSGEYTNERAAKRALKDVEVDNAYVREIVPT